MRDGCNDEWVRIHAGNMVALMSRYEDVFRNHMCGHLNCFYTDYTFRNKFGGGVRLERYIVVCV